MNLLGFVFIVILAKVSGEEMYPSGSQRQTISSAAWSNMAYYI